MGWGGRSEGGPAAARAPLPLTHCVQPESGPADSGAAIPPRSLGYHLTQAWARAPAPGPPPLSPPPPASPRARALFTVQSSRRHPPTSTPTLIPRPGHRSRQAQGGGRPYRRPRGRHAVRRPSQRRRPACRPARAPAPAPAAAAAIFGRGQVIDNRRVRRRQEGGRGGVGGGAGQQGGGRGVEGGAGQRRVLRAPPQGRQGDRAGRGGGRRRSRRTGCGQGGGRQALQGGCGEGARRGGRQPTAGA